MNESDDVIHDDVPAGRDPQLPRKPMYDDRAKVKALLKRCQRESRQDTSRQARNRADLLNLRMYRGGEENQWIVWDGNAGTYVTRPTDGDAGLPEWFPRATSNYLSNKIDGIAAIQNQSQPSKTWYATKDDDQSRAAAEVAEIADPVLLDEIEYPHVLRPRLNKFVSLTDKAALVLTYDNDPKHGEAFRPLLLCQNPQCRQIVAPEDAPDPEDACPDCGSPLDFAQDPRDPTGVQPLGEMAPKGKLHAELLSSFEITVPKNADIAHEDRLPWVCAHQRWTPEAAISRWPQLKEFIRVEGTGSATNARNTDQAYADQMRTMSAPVGGDPQGGGAPGGHTLQGPIIWRLFHDPIDDEDFYFPDGLFAVMYDGEELVLECGPLEFKDHEGRPFKNIILRQFAPAPGSAAGKPPADDLVPIQKQLNLAQSLALLILMHHASPRTFIPSTVTLYDKLTGVPGKDVGYRSLVPGDKPSVEAGVGFPSSLEWFINFLIGQFDTISKLNAVLMGERPAGDPTLGEVEILQERGFAAFQEPLEQLVSFERRLSLKLMAIARQCAWAPRFRRLLSDENGDWEYKQFTGADLEGHVDCEIELSSAWPKSPMLRNLRLMKAVELGVLNGQDPEFRQTYLQQNDLQDYARSSTADEKQVGRQLERWKTAQTPQDIAPPQPWWNLAYHLYRKSQFLKSELFEELSQQNASVAQAMLAHVGQLHTMLQPPPTRAEAVPPTKGDKGTLAQLTKAGVLKPPAGAGSRGALHAARASGVLRPAGTGKKVAAAVRARRGPIVGHMVKAGLLRPRAGQPPAPGGGVPGTTSAGNPAGAQA